MSDPGKIKCQTHGWQIEAFACQHIVQSLHTEIPVGFNWAVSATEPCPDAWCSACESVWVEAGGEWTEYVRQQLNIKVLCGACYEHAKGIWSSGRNVSQ